MISKNKYSNEIYSAYASFEAVPDSRYWKSLPPPLGLLISARISLLSLGLGRKRPHVILIVFSSDDDLLNPLPVSILTLVRASDSLQRNSGTLGNEDLLFIWSRSILNRSSYGLQTWKAIGFQLRILQLFGGGKLQVIDRILNWLSGIVGS